MVKMNGGTHADREEEEEEDEVSGAPLFLGASVNVVPNTSNKTGVKSLPRSHCCF